MRLTDQQIACLQRLELQGDGWVTGSADGRRATVAGVTARSLVRAGLAEHSTSGPRAHSRYRITDAGRVELARHTERLRARAAKQAGRLTRTPR